MSKRRRPNKGKPGPPPVKEASSSVLGTLGGHWLTPTITGAVMTFAGPGNVFVQVPVLLACGLWICSDIWVSIKKRSEHLGLWRNSIFCMSCTIVLCLASGISFWLVGESRNKDQKETRVGLVATAVAPPTLSPMESIFTIANGSEHAIGAHSFSCGINLITYNRGNGFMTQFSTTKQDFFDGRIEGNGEAESYKCLNLFGISRDQMDCLDVVAHLEYSLESQPNTREIKEFRFVAAREDGFVWTRQPLNDPKQYCLDHMSPEGRANLEEAKTKVQQKP